MVAHRNKTRLVQALLIVALPNVLIYKDLKKVDSSQKNVTSIRKVLHFQVNALVICCRQCQKSRMDKAL